MSEELEPVEGVSRRNMLKKSALVGGTMVWAAPVVQSFTAPAFGDSHGTPQGQDISFVAILVQCGNFTYRLKWEINGDHTGLESADPECGNEFALGNCNPGDLDAATGTGCPSGVSASFNSANGTVTVNLGSCTLLDYVVKCGQTCAGPGSTGNPAVPTGGSATFAPCPKPQD